MNFDSLQLQKRVANAVASYWSTRLNQFAKQASSGQQDQGARNAVTGGRADGRFHPADARPQSPERAFRPVLVHTPAMRPDHITLPKPPKDKVTEAARAAAFERKQKWKELPGNRYTPEELHRMSGEFGDCTMTSPEPTVMHID
jgi:hypothetical protein